MRGRERHSFGRQRTQVQHRMPAQNCFIGGDDLEKLFLACRATYPVEQPVDEGRGMGSSSGPPLSKQLQLNIGTGSVAFRRRGNEENSIGSRHHARRQRAHRERFDQTWPGPTNWHDVEQAHGGRHLANEPGEESFRGAHPGEAPHGRAYQQQPGGIRVIPSTGYQHDCRFADGAKSRRCTRPRTQPMHHKTPSPASASAALSLALRLSRLPAAPRPPLQRLAVLPTRSLSRCPARATAWALQNPRGRATRRETVPHPHAPDRPAIRRRNR